MRRSTGALRRLASVVGGVLCDSLARQAQPGSILANEGVLVRELMASLAVRATSVAVPVVPTHIASVFLRCSPVEVFRDVVGSIAVDVAGVVAVVRGRPSESGQCESVYPAGLVDPMHAQHGVDVTVRLCPSAEQVRIRAGSLEAADPSERASLIVPIEAGDSFPNLVHINAFHDDQSTNFTAKHGHLVASE